MTVTSPEAGTFDIWTDEGALHMFCDPHVAIILRPCDHMVSLA